MNFGKIKTGQGTMPLITLIAIWSISAIVSLPGLAVSPILGDLHKVFPKVSELEIQMLTSLPSMLIIPFVLISGRLSLSQDKFKLLYMGLGIFFLSGILCFFAKNMTMLILISSVLGIGAGLVIPLSTSLIADYFSGKYRIKQLGFSSAINNITLVLATSLTGWLANFNWHYPFVVYLLPGISILLVKYIRDAKSINNVNEVSSEKFPDKMDVKKLVSITLIYFFITYAVIIISFYLPFIVQKYGMGSSFTGTLISVFFMAIIIPGLFLNRFIDIFKNNVNFVSLIMITVGLALLVVSKSHAGLLVGCFLSGFGYGIMQPIFYEKATKISPRKGVTLSLSILMSANYLAILLCPFIIKLLTSAFDINYGKFPFILNAVLSAILVVYTFFRRKTFTFGMSKDNA